MNNILIVAAHPDDEVLGCGGTIIKHIENGDNVYVLIMATPRSQDNFELISANEVLKTSKVFSAELTDQIFDTYSINELVKKIRGIKDKVQPNIIYTHSAKDLNQDHRITHEAVLIATRPVEDECVKEIYAFETPSATEWNFGNSFIPTMYNDITNEFILKLRALECYQSELRSAPHPRGLIQTEISNRYRGLNISVEYAEAFEVIRIIK